MTTINIHQTTTATPAQILAAFTDFGPGRSTIFANSTDEYLRVYSQGPDHVDVTEGSHGIWERLHYSWSDPYRILMITTDSNIWGGNSGHTYTLTRNPSGTTDVDAVVVREGKNIRGRLLALVLGAGGTRVLAKQFGQTIKAVEARYQNTSAADLS